MPNKLIKKRENLHLLPLFINHKELSYTPQNIGYCKKLTTQYESINIILYSLE